MLPLNCFNVVVQFEFEFFEFEFNLNLFEPFAKKKENRKTHFQPKPAQPSFSSSLPAAQFSSPARSFFLAQSVAPSPLSLADVRGPPVRASFPAVAEQDSAPSPLPRAPPGLSWLARQGNPSRPYLSAATSLGTLSIGSRRL